MQELPGLVDAERAGEKVGDAAAYAGASYRQWALPARELAGEEAAPSHLAVAEWEMVLELARRPFEVFRALDDW